jgi:alkylation response protein AidB-like acyl-CoA dehydrogenase
MAIDFTLSTAQLELQTNALAFAKTVLSKVCGTITPIATPEGCFFATQPFYEEIAKAGFVHALISSEYGGNGMSLLDLAL